MIAEKIDAVVIALNGLAGEIPAEQWDVISSAQRELRDASEQASQLEKHATVAKGDTHGKPN